MAARSQSEMALPRSQPLSGRPQVIERPGKSSADSDELSALVTRCQDPARLVQQDLRAKAPHIKFTIPDSGQRSSPCLKERSEYNLGMMLCIYISSCPKQESIFSAEAAGTTAFFIN